MKILLDTHTLIWFLKGDNKISDYTIDLIRRKDNVRYVSIVSLWEIVIKSSLNKLDFKKSIPEMFRLLFQNNIGLITIVPEYLTVLNDLPHHHGDPFDRMLISQAISENLIIITADKNFALYPVDILW